MRKLLPPALAAFLLAGCATIGEPPPASELVGETVRLETARGQASTLRFRRDGVVVARFGDNEVQGRWRYEEDGICFYWSGAPRECWPYRGRFRRGVPVPVTSTRGNRITVTLL